MRCTIWMRRSTSPSMISWRRCQQKAANKVYRIGSGWRRTSRGGSAAARSRYWCRTLGCISAKRLSGNPRVSIACNFSNSRSTLRRETRPGSVFRALKEVPCQSEPSSPAASSLRLEVSIRASSALRVRGKSLAAVLANISLSCMRTAERTRRSIRPSDGRSISRLRYHSCTAA